MTDPTSPGPALPPDPPHPEPHTMTWSKLELEAIRAYARQAVEAREADREDAERYRHLCSQGSIIPRPSLWDAGVGFTGLLVPRKSGAMTKAELDAAIDKARAAIAAAGSKAK